MTFRRSNSEASAFTMAFPGLGHSGISRFLMYFRRNGIRATLQRVRRAIFGIRLILFYCDLAEMSRNQSEALPGGLVIEVKSSEAELAPADRSTLLNGLGPQRAKRKMAEGFRKGAALWLVKNGAALLGYGWTVQGPTLEPHFFPLTPDDVYFFDFQIFPPYRGNGLNPLLLCHILCTLAAQGKRRAFMDVAEFNRPQLSSLRRTPFRRMGAARKITLAGRAIVCWTEQSAMEQPRSLVS